MELCACQSGKIYANCCAPLHQGKEKAQTALQLMRSRYCAISLGMADYIVQTTLPCQQDKLDKKALNTWIGQTKWCGLNILSNDEAFAPKKAFVEFKAFYIAQETQQTHHEKSLFYCQDGQWYFVDPNVNYPTQKSACFCGSGKKFKHCCGKLLEQFATC